MIDRLTDRVQQGLRMNFSQFAGAEGNSKAQGSRHTVSKEEKVLVIVSFLAMLELVKQGVIQVSQDAYSDDITMQTETLGVPNYH